MYQFSFYVPLPKRSQHVVFYVQRTGLGVYQLLPAKQKKKEMINSCACLDVCMCLHKMFAKLVLRCVCVCMRVLTSLNERG